MIRTTTQYRDTETRSNNDEGTSAKPIISILTMHDDPGDLVAGHSQLTSAQITMRIMAEIIHYHSSGVKRVAIY
jgi:hypothetical protein